VTITHPFHPESGRSFDLADRQHVWGQDRVYLRMEDGHVVHVPLAWTSLSPPDPIVVQGAGRARLRADDLVALAILIGSLRPRPGAPNRRRR